tara:strand:- start:734 stop:2782 length:2049 start_codon:yes stop_codon:yes gene_type:complete
MDEYNFGLPIPDLPLLKALESDDLPAAVLPALRKWLMPGEEVKWASFSTDGFWWVPYRLKHSVEVLRKQSAHGENRWICRSTITLVEEVEEDVSELFSIVSYLNSLPFGASVWVDVESNSIKATSWTKLDPKDWYLVVCFQDAVAQKISFCEFLAPRLAELAKGKVPFISHPVHGIRQEPDQFLEDGFGLYDEPEATLGTWWTEKEIEMFRISLSTAFERFERAIDLRVATSEDMTSAVNLSTQFTFKKELEAHLGDIKSLSHHVSIGQRFHQSLGRGIEILLETPFDLDGNTDMSKQQNSSFNAQALANELNFREVDRCSEPIGISGWTARRDKICLSTFIKAKTVAYLQQIISLASHPEKIGTCLGLLTTKVLGRYVAPANIITQDWYKEDWSLTEDKRWDGVEDYDNSDSCFNPLLLHGSETFDFVTAVASLKVNVLEESPPYISPSEPSDHFHPYLFDASTLLLASFGIFNPAGPSVGSLEITTAADSEFAVLFERLRHPHSPHIILHALIDLDGVPLMDEFVEKVIAKFNWSTLDWFEIVKGTEDFNEAVLKGLTKFGERLKKENNRDLRQEAIRLQLPPWKRLEVPHGKKLVKLSDTGIFHEEFFLQNPAADVELHNPEYLSDVDFWTTTLTNRANIDNHIKFLRSAWESSKLFPIDMDRAQLVANTMSSYVEIRE